MSSKKIEHSAQELAGKAKEAAGKVTNDRDLEAEGAAEQDEARLKKAGDDLKDAASNVKRAVTE